MTDTTNANQWDGLGLPRMKTKNLKKKTEKQQKETANEKDNSEEIRRKAEIEQKIRRRVAMEEKAFRLVERLIVPNITEGVLKDAGQCIDHNHYNDIVEERAISRLCGYPVCQKHLVNVPKKKYHISTKTNQVYEISERKNFCSAQCFKASKYFEKQISTTPVWLRENEATVEFKLLDIDTIIGSFGELVITSPSAQVKAELVAVNDLDCKLSPHVTSQMQSFGLEEKLDMCLEGHAIGLKKSPKNIQSKQLKVAACDVTTGRSSTEHHTKQSAGCLVDAAVGPSYESSSILVSEEEKNPTKTEMPSHAIPFNNNPSITPSHTIPFNNNPSIMPSHTIPFNNNPSITPSHTIPFNNNPSISKCLQVQDVEQKEEFTQSGNHTIENILNRQTSPVEEMTGSSAEEGVEQSITKLETMKDEDKTMEQTDSKSKHTPESVRSSLVLDQVELWKDAETSSRSHDHDGDDDFEPVTKSMLRLSLSRLIQDGDSDDDSDDDSCNVSDQIVDFDPLCSSIDCDLLYDQEVSPENSERSCKSSSNVLISDLPKTASGANASQETSSESKSKNLKLPFKSVAWSETIPSHDSARLAKRNSSRTAGIIAGEKTIAVARNAVEIKQNLTFEFNQKKKVEEIKLSPHTSELKKKLAQQCGAQGIHAVTMTSCTALRKRKVMGEIRNHLKDNLKSDDPKQPVSVMLDTSAVSGSSVKSGNVLHSRTEINDGETDNTQRYVENICADTQLVHEKTQKTLTTDNILANIRRASEQKAHLGTQLVQSKSSTVIELLKPCAEKTKPNIEITQQKLNSQKVNSQKVKRSMLDIIKQTLSEWKTTKTVHYLNGTGGSSFSERYDEYNEQLAARDVSDLVDELSFDDSDKPKGKLPQLTELAGNKDYAEKVAKFYAADDQAIKTTKSTSRTVDKDIVLPLVDSYSQMSHRRKIVQDKIHKVFPDLIGPLKMTFSDMPTDIRKLVNTFDLSSTNIILKPAEWTIMAYFLLHLLSVRSRKLQVVMEGEYARHYFKTMLLSVRISPSDVRSITNFMMAE